MQADRRWPRLAAAGRCRRWAAAASRRSTPTPGVGPRACRAIEVEAPHGAHRLSAAARTSTTTLARDRDKPAVYRLDVQLNEKPLPARPAASTTTADRYETAAQIVNYSLIEIATGKVLKRRATSRSR